MLILRSIVGMILLLAACGGRQQTNGDLITQRELKEPLIAENKRLTKEESKQIEKFIERYKWTMVETGTGLQYMIYQQSDGIPAKTGMHATVEYEIKLLDGTLCYSSVQAGPKSFVIGRDNVESGIHEGILYMKENEKAKFILPSYLAHGLTGDLNKIPPRSILVIDLHLLKLN